MQPSKILAALSCALYAYAYIEYNRNVIRGTTKPNGATWAIWSVIAIISTSSYFVASGDIWKSLIPLANILLCVGTFVLAFSGGKFKKLNAIDWCALTIGIAAAVVWKMTTATYGNLIVQVAIITGFIPTWRNVWKTPSCEDPFPWWMWCGSYVIAMEVVILRWRHQWIDLVYPTLCIFLHASVPLVGIISRKTRTT